MKICTWIVLGGMALVGCGESGKSAVQAVAGSSEQTITGEGRKPIRFSLP